MDIPEGEWAVMRDMVMRLDKTVNGNGKPSLEDRLRAYIDERDTHKENNTKQVFAAIREDVDEKHEENRKKIDFLAKRLGQLWDYSQQAKGAKWAGGAAFALVVILVQHYWK